MRPFSYSALPVRTVFGTGSRERLPEELRSLGLRRVLLIASARQLEAQPDLSELLAGHLAGSYTAAAMHTPLEVTEDAHRQLQALEADALVAIGGGSAIGLGKALALRSDLPLLALPTTYSGSEMTPILGERAGGVKTTRRDPRALPRVVLYDPQLTVSLPVALSVASGINALAHAVEALYAFDGNPVTSLLAEEAVRALGRGLPQVASAPGDLTAREAALYGAWLAGTALASVSMALQHKLAHVLGGSFDLPHAETHAALLPHTAAYNAPEAPEAMQRVAAALGALEEAPQALFALNVRLNAPRSLRELGMPRDGIGRAADLALQTPYPNPRPLEREALLELLERAWAGDPPRSPGK
ncbi:alcohol dehydrogenase class IV [Deinobacterium chartae]|uniref:Alcohol dehydrogenase class IV n=1 Tax=Deinobacterium chartae TaxID=521158 RepID=A0A841HW92_9DEIO|nr:maleylacetate reductase [Deinobacterium chartae]MBB6097186.1 alcohol dehydrogenase class IV [Deinobacterium chartae]